MIYASCFLGGLVFLFADRVGVKGGGREREEIIKATELQFVLKMEKF